MIHTKTMHYLPHYLTAVWHWHARLIQIVAPRHFCLLLQKTMAWSYVRLMWNGISPLYISTLDNITIEHKIYAIALNPIRYILKSMSSSNNEQDNSVNSKVTLCILLLTIALSCLHQELTNVHLYFMTPQNTSNEKLTKS